MISSQNYLLLRSLLPDSDLELSFELAATSMRFMMVLSGFEEVKTDFQEFVPADENILRETTPRRKL